jgi:homoserine O-acetyltransferase
MKNSLVFSVAALFCTLSWVVIAADYPSPVEGDWTVSNFKFHTGETVPTLNLHYRTVGAPGGEPVLVLHGTSGDGTRFLADAFAQELFAPGQPLDANKYFIILPDSIGHGQSSKPSDGLKGRFPRYNYTDMVQAQYRLVTEHLGIDHLRLIIGGSMGGMHAWLWAEMYPDFMDAIMPLQCLPVQIAGMNRMLRRIAIDGIRNDPAYLDGDYVSPPTAGLTIAAYSMLGLFGSPLQLLNAAPTREQADAEFDRRVQAGLANDANDMLYAIESSSDYDPAPGLEGIKARVLALNTADDTTNQPELGVMEREIQRVKNGRFVLIPRSSQTVGHGSYSIGALYGSYISQLLESE